MINSINLKNFRKFENLNLEFKNKIIIFTGQNAVGKTTILEAIYLISTSKSHRTNDIKTIIKDEKDFSNVILKGDKTYKIEITKDGKKSFINDIPYQKISEFIGRIPVIMFSPYDIDLILGTKMYRRRFLDLEISLLDKNYLRNISIYKKLLKERNELLKIYSSDKKIMLDVITKQLEELIKKIYDQRRLFLDLLNNKLKYVCNKLECETLNLQYLPTYDINNLDESFNLKLKYDILTKTTNIGIHRDDFQININSIEAKEYASEGQMRNAILAIKLALKEIYSEKNKDIILLLDDVFSSIDQKRINHIMEYIKSENQTFITTTSLFNIPDYLLKEAQIIRL